MQAATARRAYADNLDFVHRDSDEVSKNFPNVDIELLSPAFASPETVLKGFSEGTSGPTSLDTIDRFLRSIASRHDWASYHTPSFTSEEGRIMPYLCLSTTKGDTPCQDHAKEKLRIWLQGGQHGDEPAGDQSILALLGKFDDNSTWAESMLQQVDIMALPRYNPDGITYFQRTFASNYDPNRDHTYLQRQQTRDIKTLLSDFSPHIVLDAHEFNATAPVGPKGEWTKAQDCLLSGSKNLNIHEDIRGLTEGLFTNSIGAALEKRKLRWSPFFNGGDGNLDLSEPGSLSRAGHSSAGLLQAVTFLLEIRGISLADQHFQRRVAAGLTVLETLVTQAAENARGIYKTIEDARQKFTNSTEDIVVTDKARSTSVHWTFIDSKNGSLVDIPVTFKNNTPPVANLTRARPEAYVFSAAFSDVADKLRASGVKVEPLEHDFEGTVEVLKVRSAREQSSPDSFGVTVTTRAFEKEVKIPAGGFWVDTRQKNAAVAFVTLEPENSASYVKYNVIPLRKGDEYPIFRVLRK
ncbi:carboxypeptidase 2 [Verticillium dahliae]